MTRRRSPRHRRLPPGTPGGGGASSGAASGRAVVAVTAALAAAALLAAACDGAGRGRPGERRAGESVAGAAGAAGAAPAARVAVRESRGVAASSQQPRSPLPDTVFVRLVAELSEPGAYFDTDNLISNEASYLQVMGSLEARDVRGGAYIGVGPAQNFSYIAAIRPALAFIVDIRRDNLLQHLWFRALFESAESRLDYLCLMVARRCGGRSEGLDVEALVARVDRAPSVPAPDSLIDRIVRAAAAVGVPLSGEDRATIRAIHGRFAADGLGLRFHTIGRAPRPEYPTFRRLLLETDDTGRHSGYLGAESSYRAVRALQRANRVVPVVGDLAGPHALRAIGRESRRRGLTVSAFYTSNVEFYLFREGTFPRFVDNVASLPIDGGTVIIRSYFNRFRPLPETRPGDASTQLLDPVGSLLERWRDDRIPSYAALVGEPVGTP